MPPNYFQKPETALKRAQELISVGKEHDALDVLHDTIKARRHKTWSKTHELIMLKHLSLCVVLRKPHVAKDALFQYKALTQQVAVKSLEVVIQNFLELAEQKTEEAQKTSIEKVEEIDDLDQADAPENLLLSAVSGAAAQDRMDRTVLSPWLRFLWDSYRNCLDLLRNNSQVEQLYHRIARQSFAFCAKYQRRTEFRKLCEHLRLHLNQIQKHQHLNHTVKLTSLDSLTLMQDTRLIQFDTAISMELWQEAYRSAEDVHGMMQLSKDKDKRMVKPASYVNYYDKLALVFWKAGNRLFHAAALLQKFIIYKDMKKSFTSEEAQDQATRVLLATLSVADGADNPSDLTRHLDIEEIHTANIRLLSQLLRLPIAPTRAGILKEIVRLSLPDVANETSRQLFSLLENTFSPLRLAAAVQEELTKIGQLNRLDYSQYLDALREVAATRTLKQVSMIYDSLSLKRISAVIPYYNSVELERFLVDVSKHRIVKAQLDHRDKCVRFGSMDATLAGGDFEQTGNLTGDDSVLSGNGVRSHLQSMYTKLRNAVNMLDAGARQKTLLDRLKHHAAVYSYHKKDDYDRILQRRKKIEYYKETSEMLKREKSQAAAAEASKKEDARRQEEMRRLEIQNREAEKRRREADQEEIKIKVHAEQMKKIKKTAIYEVIVRERGEEAFRNMDPQAVFAEELQRMKVERAEQQQRLQLQERKYDHLVRAYHLEELKERKKDSDDYRAKAPYLHDEYERERVAKAIAEREKTVSTHERMARVREDAKKFLENVRKSHEEEWKKSLADYETAIKKTEKDILTKRAAKRKMERKKEWEEAKAREAREREREEQERIRSAEEEKRRALRGDRDRTRMERESDEPTKSDMDANWRGGGRRVVATPPTMHPMRSEQREPVSSSAADTGPWRRQAGQMPPGPPQQQPIRAAPIDETGPIRRGQPLPPAPTPYGREPLPPSVADQTDNWRKKTELPPAQSQRAPSPERAPSNQPWRPARDRQGAAPPVASMTNERYISGPPQSMRSGGPDGGYSPGDQGGPWRQSSRGPGAEQPIMQRRDFSGPSGGPSPMRQQQRHDEEEGNWRQQQRVPPPPANSPYGAVGPMRPGSMGQQRDDRGPTGQQRDDRGPPPPSENMMRRPMGEKPPPSTGAPPPSGQADQDKNWRKRPQQQQQCK